MRHKMVTSAVLTASLLLPLSACAASTKKADASPEAPASPTPNAADLLAAAVAKTRATSFKVLLDDGTGAAKADDKADGQYDAKNGLATFTGSADGDTATFTVTPDLMYLSGLKDLKGQVLRLKIVKLRQTSTLVAFADPLAGLEMLGAATGVTSTAPGSFAGTVDVSTVHEATAGAKAFVTAITTAGGAAAKTIHFVARTDAQGYVSEFEARLPKLDSGEDLEYAAHYSAFGTPVTIAVPTRHVIDAPADFYQQT